jgi:hypothetical protein
MVRRFRYLTRYPDKYPASLPADQSSVPSQRSPVPPAFDPSMNPDMQFEAREGVPDIAIVRATFDSRPPYAYDFFWEDFWFLSIPFNSPTPNGYTVPLGYNLILREITISIYLDGGQPLISAFGDWAVGGDGVPPPPLQILIDGIQTPNFTAGQVLLYDAFFSDVQVPTFILVPGGSTVVVNLPGITDLSLGVGGFNTYVHYSGNILVDTGRNLVNEVGNKYPLPVVDTSKG